MYALDTQSAREADNIGSYLKETGKYKGTFTRAEALVSQNKGTHGIGITFESESKQSTRFDLWVKDRDGKELQGYKTLQAILTVLKLRGIAPKPGQVDRYNYETKKTDKVQADVFPDLVGKPIGIVLRSTEYEKMKNGALTGETGWRLEPVVPFQADTEFTASEILDRKTKPEKLSSIVATLADRPLRNRTTTTRPADHDGFAPHDAQPAGFDEDSIPF